MTVVPGRAGTATVKDRVLVRVGSECCAKTPGRSGGSAQISWRYTPTACTQPALASEVNAVFTGMLKHCPRCAKEYRVLAVKAPGEVATTAEVAALVAQAALALPA